MIWGKPYYIHKMAIMFMSLVILLCFLPAMHQANARKIRFWTERSVNLGKYDSAASPITTPLLISEFYPLGFSRDGWFAYTGNRNGDNLDDMIPPKKAGVSLINIRCDDQEPCLKDSPNHKGDICFCPIGTTVKDLARFHIQPLNKPLYGSFPTMFKGDEYDVEIRFQQELFPSESPRGPKSAGTEIYLISKKRGKQLISTVGHNHSGILSHSVQVAGWIKSPFTARIVVIIAGIIEDYGSEDSGKKVIFYPVGAKLD